MTNKKLRVPQKGDPLALRKVDLHKKTIEALEAMATEGIDLKRAASAHDVDAGTLHRALAREKVKRAFNQVVADIRENAGMRAYLRINEMGHEAKSETVKLDANKYIAGVAGISPIKKVEGRMQHNVTFGGFDFEQSAPIDVTPEDSQSPADDD